MERAEEYWNSKHPVVEQLYHGRYVPGSDRRIVSDVRSFICPDDIVLKRLLMSDLYHNGAQDPKTSHDDMAWFIQRWCCEFMTYVHDDAARGHTEFWQYPNETLTLKTGDCEDGAIMMASLAINAGIPQWRVRVAAGYVQEAPTAPQGGHGYWCYCRELDNEWVPMDWCFYPDEKVPVAKKKLLKDNPLYKATWFSFNGLYAWAHEDWRMTGRVKNVELGKAA